MNAAAIVPRLAALSGRRRGLLATGLGALATLALPPLHQVYLLIPVFAGLLLLAETARTWKGTFVAGWLFGVGFFALGLYWTSFALLTDPVRYGWMIPFALAGLGGGLGLFTGAATAAFRALTDRVALAPVGRVLVFAASWVAAEWLRGVVLTGFPWNLMGTVWAFSDSMIQGAAVFGVYGLSLLTVAAAAMPAVLAAPPPARGGRMPVGVAFAVLALVGAGGWLRLDGATGKAVDGVRLRLVQPAIPQVLKWKTELRREHVLKELAMSAKPPAPATPPPTHVIWAETAVPFYLNVEPKLIEALGTVAPVGGAVIVGAPRVMPTGGRSFKVFNSLFVVLPGGRVSATYDKFHLVPFGEFVPLRRWLDSVQILGGGSDFSAGPGLVSVSVPGAPPFSPLICYEAIFPGRVVDPKDRPGWLLNITNDAWFGRSAGPYQHFAAARLRAVEEGLPLVRVANTGISAVVDGYGRVRARLGLGREGIVDAALPVALPPPPFARFGGTLPAVLLVACAGFAFACFRRGG